MTQQQRKHKLNEKLTNLRVKVAFTSIKSLEREATKLASEFSEYTDELSKELEAQRIRAEEAEGKLIVLQESVDQANYQAQQAIQQLYDEKEVMDKQTTERIRERNQAEQERDRLSSVVSKIEDAILDIQSWTEFSLFVDKEIHDYREGSNTDAKRD